MDINVETFKILAIVVIILAGIAGGLLPLRIRMTNRGHRLMVFGNAFAGGIFLGAALLHLIPDGQEHFVAVAPDEEYPIVLLLAGVGFLGVLFLEKVLARGAHDDEFVASGVGVYPMLLLLVLSVHSIIAGMSLGLENALLSSVSLFVAIIAHKSSAAFALGVSLKSAGVSAGELRRNILLFSIMTPLGILIGLLLLQTQSEEPELLEAIFDGIAAGTFLYIAVLDILREVFEEQVDRFYRFLLVGVGFTLMAVIALVA